MSTKISVIICTYNRANYIIQAIDSVLVQNYDNFEVVIIDDASTDNTQIVLKKYAHNSKVKIILNETNLGITKSRNKGVSLASGDYIAMLDSDDYWTDTEKLKKQAGVLDSNQKIGIIGSAITLIDGNGIKIKDETCYIDDTKIRAHMLWGNQFMQSAILFRKVVFEEVGGYNESLTVAEDFDLWLRIGKMYTFSNLPESTVCYRVHGGNISKNTLRMARAVDHIIDQYRNDYPNYWLGKIKSIVRITASYLHLR